ncbi:hypothetical protein GTO27_01305, partial [Candidatus Bathyarchaeota archaeon]|nr:hypothetical protein [Candidatus Bathyarchaeota archaeon]
EQKRRRVVNIVELGDDGLVYIRLDDGKKYLLNGDGCWRCGSRANCFGNMEEGDHELEVICEFDFFDEVRSLFLCLLQDRVTKLVNWLFEGSDGKACSLVDRLVAMFSKAIGHMNAPRARRIPWQT